MDVSALNPSNLTSSPCVIWPTEGLSKSLFLYKELGSVSIDIVIEKLLIFETFHSSTCNNSTQKLAKKYSAFYLFLVKGAKVVLRLYFFMTWVICIAGLVTITENISRAN